MKTRQSIGALAYDGAAESRIGYPEDYGSNADQAAALPSTVDPDSLLALADEIGALGYDGPGMSPYDEEEVALALPPAVREPGTLPLLEEDGSDSDLEQSSDWSSDLSYDDDEDEVQAPVLAPPTEGIGEDHPAPWNRLSRGSNRTDSTTGLRLKGMSPSPHYDGETRKAGFRPPPMWSAAHNRTVGPDGQQRSFDNVFTHYLDDGELAANSITPSVGADGRGRLVGGSGARVDTRDADGTGTQAMVQADGTRRRQGQGRHIFTMAPDRSMTAMDPWAHRKLKHRDAIGDQPAGDELGMINHSSLVQGGEIAAAGDLAVDDGRVTEITNASGHYQPDVGHLLQAFDQLRSWDVLSTEGPNAAKLGITHGGTAAPTQVPAHAFLAASGGGDEGLVRNAFGDQKRLDATHGQIQRKDAVLDDIRSGNFSLRPTPPRTDRG